MSAAPLPGDSDDDVGSDVSDDVTAPDDELQLDSDDDAGVDAGDR